MTSRQRPRRGLSRERLRRGLWRWVARAPLLLYRWGLGGLLGRRFVRLTHYGRRSGRRYHTVVEVVHYDSAANTLYIVAGFGPGSDWYRNLQAHPTTEITWGWHSYPARARFVPPEQGAQVLRAYIQQHPTAARHLGQWLLGQPLTPDMASTAFLEAFVKDHPLVALELGGNARATAN